VAPHRAFLVLPADLWCVGVETAVWTLGVGPVTAGAFFWNWGVGFVGDLEDVMLGEKADSGDGERLRFFMLLRGKAC